MEKAPDFVFTHTLGELLEKYTGYAKSSTSSAYLCYMYAEECGIPIAAICDREAHCDALQQIIKLCPDLFYEQFTGNTIDSSLTGLAFNDLNGKWGTWYEILATLRMNLIKEMIRRFGEDFEFTVNVWVY